MTPARNPHWHPADRLHRGRVPAAVRGWLFAGGSLTAHVRAVCPERFRLRILRQRVAPPRRDEARLLGIPPGGRALVREIELCCGTQPLVVARTIIPLASLRGRQQRLAGLGQRPLGALLFADRSARREPYQIARLTLRQAGIAQPPVVGAPLWGRRAVFRLGGAPLLVSEFFLPVLCEPRAD